MVGTATLFALFEVAAGVVELPPPLLSLLLLVLLLIIKKIYLTNEQFYAIYDDSICCRLLISRVSSGSHGHDTKFD